MIHDQKQGGFLQVRRSDAQSIHAALIAGLQADPAATSPKYFYDLLGSKLFEAICELPEYYLTRAEAGIFGNHREEIAEAIGTGKMLIDLGAGNCAKAEGWFTALRPAQYVPVDISAEFLQDSVRRLQARFPEIRMIPLGLDFSDSLDLPEQVRRENRLFFYPGSSIGNFHPSEALTFLRRLRDACDESGSLLIGVDLMKGRKTLEDAYNDALGVTAAFNLNLLRHFNRLLGADFDVRGWRHRAFFDPEKSCMEMHLEARRDTIVKWPGGERRFGEGERIHTESSYKYARQDFHAMLEEAGFGACESWTDENDWFMVCHAKAA